VPSITWVSNCLTQQLSPWNIVQFPQQVLFKWKCSWRKMQMTLDSGEAQMASKLKIKMTSSRRLLRRGNSSRMGRGASWIRRPTQIANTGAIQVRTHVFVSDISITFWVVPLRFLCLGPQIAPSANFGVSWNM